MSDKCPFLQRKILSLWVCSITNKHCPYPNKIHNLCEVYNLNKLTGGKNDRTTSTSN